MKAGYTHIVALMDRSGSMSNIISDMRGGFIQFLEDQTKIPGDLTLSTVIFDDQYEQLTDFLPIKTGTTVDLSKYTPRNSTALIESFCKAIDQTGKSLANMAESDRPEKVLFICVTDGHENASGREFTRAMLNQKIKTQKEQFNWSFVFMGANQDSFAEGASMGVSGNATMNFAANSTGVRSLYTNLTQSTASYRQSATMDAFAFEPEQQEEVK